MIGGANNIMFCVLHRRLLHGRGISRIGIGQAITQTAAPTTSSLFPPTSCAAHRLWRSSSHGGTHHVDRSISIIFSPDSRRMRNNHCYTQLLYRHGDVHPRCNFSSTKVDVGALHQVRGDTLSSFRYSNYYILIHQSINSCIYRK